MKVPYGYLNKQYNEETIDFIWENYIKPVVVRGDFTLGKEVREFELKLCELTGSKYAIGVANGTDAIELSLIANGVGPGCEVIVPVNTFIASASAIFNVGAMPIFCDTNTSFVMDHNKIEDLITERTKVILPVHFQGQPCAMDIICDIADKHKLIVIEDAAQALNASINGKDCGTWGKTGCISFHPQKNLNCWGDGGAILTNDDTIYQYLILLRNHGMSSRDIYEICSRNSRLDTIQAAVLLRDIVHLKHQNDLRIAIANRYNKELSNIKEIILPPSCALIRHTYHLYMIEVSNRNMLLKYLHYNGIDARVHYPIPLHLQNAFKFKGHKYGDFPRAEHQAQNMISLPIHQFMKNEEVDYVIQVIKRFYN